MKNIYMRLLAFYNRLKNWFLKTPENVCYNVKRLDGMSAQNKVGFVYGQGTYADYALEKFVGNVQTQWIDPDGSRTIAWPFQISFPRGTLLLRREELGRVVYYVENVERIRKWNKLTQLREIVSVA